MSKRKPIEMIKNKYTPLIKMEDELSTLVQFQENIMAEVIDRQDEAYANFLINQITLFMEENNVSTCFVLNKEELLDCLKEHNKLHYEILNLQSQLDQAKSEITKYKILLNDMETENSHLETMLDQANERLKVAINKPKFEHFEICFYIENNPYCNNELQIFRGEILEINVAFDEDYLYEYRFDTSCRYIEENMIFETFEEAEKKLQELQNGDFSGE